MARVYVSDHALVRWLERVGGVDMDFFRDHISSLVEEAFDTGFDTITIDSFTYMLDRKDRCVKTVLEPRQRPKKCKSKMPRPDRRYGDRDDIELGLLEMQAAE